MCVHTWTAKSTPARADHHDSLCRRDPFAPARQHPRRGPAVPRRGLGRPAAAQGTGRIDHPDDPVHPGQRLATSAAARDPSDRVAAPVAALPPCAQQSPAVAAGGRRALRRSDCEATSSNGGRTSTSQLPAGRVPAQLGAPATGRRVAPPAPPRSGPTWHEPPGRTSCPRQERPGHLRWGPAGSTPAGTRCARRGGRGPVRTGAG